MIRGDPTLKECLELLQARTGRGLVEISQAIAEIEERSVAAKTYPSAQSFLEIQSVAQAAFQRWVDRAIADLRILLSAGNLNKKTVNRMAALELGEFAEKIKDATKAETFRNVVKPRSINAERHMYAQLLMASSVASKRALWNCRRWRLRSPRSALTSRIIWRADAAKTVLANSTSDGEVEPDDLVQSGSDPLHAA